MIRIAHDTHLRPYIIRPNGKELFAEDKVFK